VIEQSQQVNPVEAFPYLKQPLAALAEAERQLSMR
jgi:hypothetical protein